MAAEVDPQRAASFFAEAAALCERESGRPWGVSLCGPMVVADAATRTRAIPAGSAAGHELFHRVQPELGLVTPEADNAHLDSDGPVLVLPGAPGSFASAGLTPIVLTT